MSEPIHEESLPVRPVGFFAQLSSWFRDRINGLAEFIGMVIAMFGCSAAQLVFALGLGFLAAGLGRAIEQAPRGPRWMFIGAVLIGVSIPFKRK